MVAFHVLFRLCFEIQGIACYCRGSDNGDRMLGKLLVKVDKNTKITSSIEHVFVLY